MQDPTSRYDLTSTENLLQQKISDQSDKLGTLIRELHTSIKEQGKSIDKISSRLNELSNEIAEKTALNIRRDHDKAKQQRADTLWPILSGMMTGLIILLSTLIILS